MEDIQKSLQNLVEMGIIFSGEYKQTNGIITFKPLSTEEFKNKIDSKDIQNLAYYTKSMGRGIFTIGADGKFVNFKGVDSQLQNNQVIDDTATQYYSLPTTNDYNVSFAYFGHDKSFDIRVTGASAIKNLEKEIKKLYELKSTGSNLLKLPDITNIIELDSEFCREHDIPMTISISNEEMQLFSQAQSNMLEIESIARNAIGEENFNVDANTRCEKWKEFFSRIAEKQGMSYEDYIKNIVVELSKKFDTQVSIEDLEKIINFLDNKYAFGQKFGQAIRIIENPFRMTDLKAEIINAIKTDEPQQEVKENLKEIISFSAKCLGLNNEQEYLLHYAEIMGKNIAGLLNENWMYNNWSHRQDFSLSGELCDDAFEKVTFYEQSQLTQNQDMDISKHNEEMSQQAKKYFYQTYLFASNMKIIEDAYKIAGLEVPNNYKEIFIDSIFENLNVDKKIEIIEKLEIAKSNDILSNIYNINPIYIKNTNEKTGEQVVEIKNSEAVYKNFEGYEEYIKSFHDLLIDKVLVEKVESSKSPKKEIDNIKLMCEKIFKDIQLNGIEEIRKLFSEGTNLTERLQFDPVKEYVKKIIMSQMDIDKMLLSHKYFDKDFDSISGFRKESDELYKKIYGEFDLKFDKKTIEDLFGNSLNIISEEDYEEWKEFAYGIHNGIKYDDIYLEEEFRYNYENEKNIVKKFINSFHYKKIIKGNFLEDECTKRVREMLRKEISKNSKNTFVAHSNVHRMIEKGLVEYESNKEIEDIARMSLIPFTKSKVQGSINIEQTCKSIRREMKSEIGRTKTGENYRQKAVTLGSESGIHKTPVFQTIPFEEVPQAIQKLQEEYENLYNNELSQEEYIKGVTKIYADFIFIQPYEDGNKRTALCLLNSMLMSKNIIPPPISLTNDQKMIEAYYKAQEKDYEMLQRLVVQKCTKMKKTSPDDKNSIDKGENNENWYRY